MSQIGSPRPRRGKLSSRRLNSQRPCVEFLELRQLLATVDWTNPAGGSWDVASNWSTDTVPGSNDNVIIDVSGASPTVTINSTVEAVNSITAADPISISGGGLTVAADSTISGGLAMTGGTITASGSGVDVVVTGTTTDSGGSLYAENGATLDLAQLTGFAGGDDYTDTLQATGAGSILSLPDLAKITENANGYSYTQVQALAGANVQLPALTQISGGPVLLEANGASSQLNVAALTSFSGNSGQAYLSALQITNGGKVLDPVLSEINGLNLIGDSTGTFTISTTLGFTISGGTSTVQSDMLLDEGDLSVQSGATLNIEGGLSVNGSGILTTATAGMIEISRSLLGTTQNADDFDPKGTVKFDSGTGTSNPPQELEAMSDDLGAVQAGFANNFAYGTISSTSDTSVELVDLSHNTSSTSPEAVYANELIVPSGATLNLNNLNLYVRGDQISGTIVGGTVTIVPVGGSIALNTPTPGTLTPAGAVEDWTFYGTTGETITVQLNPGGSGSYPAVSPQLNWGEVELLDPNNDVLASASSGSSGAIAAISAFALSANETYTLQVQAPADEGSSTGNYGLAAYNVTPDNYSLSVNQKTTGSIHGAYGVDQYSFTASANEQVGLNVISAAGGYVAFTLTGPGGKVFANLQANSGPVTLPSSGTYTLTVQGTGGQGGAHAFELQQTSVNSLTLGKPYSGTLAGSGQAQLFSVNLPVTQALLVTLKDSPSADVNQIYAKLGSPPTQSNYGYAFSDRVSANQQLLVPSAAPGTWYILVYSVSIPAASTFSLSAAGEPVTLTTVAPTESATGSTATLTLTGSGFNSASSVDLVSSGNTIYNASSVTLDTFTQLSATFNLSCVPQGTYSVVVKSSAGASTSLSGAFTVTAAGEAHFVYQLVLPSQMGRHISSTIYVDYSNTGTVAMPAPLLVLYAPPEVVDGQTVINLPLMTLNPALVVSGYWTSALPEGYSNSVEILATGTQVPGMLEPGESVSVPVYYAGMQQPWSFAESSFQFAVDYYTQHDSTALDWNSLEASLQPPGLSNTAWSAIFTGLMSQMGDTWGGYVTTLDDEASYLGNLGQSVTDVSDLWAFAVAQADGLTPMPVLASVTDLDVAVPGDLSLDGKGKKAKKETVIVVEYSAALNAASADNASAYDLASIIKVKAKGKGKNRQPATTKLGAAVPAASAIYSNGQVTLTPRVKLTPSKPEELTINGTLVTDTLGRGIDGADDGISDSDYIATITGTRVATGGIPLVRTQRRQAGVADVVDYLLVRGELTELKAKLQTPAAPS